MLRRYGKGEGKLTTYLFIQLDKQLIRDVNLLVPDRGFIRFMCTRDCGNPGKLRLLF